VSKILSSLVSIASACRFRCDHGAGQPLSFDECVEAVAHPTAGLKPDELRQVIAWLAAQLVGYEHRADQNAMLALGNIERIVTDYRERTR
jgi:hypothetical protein